MDFLEDSLKSYQIEIKEKAFQELLLDQDKLHDQPSMTADWDMLRQEYKAENDLLGTGLQLDQQPMQMLGMQEQNEADVQELIARQTNILGQAVAFNALELPAFGLSKAQPQSSKEASEERAKLVALGEKYSIPIALVDPKAVLLVESYNNAIAKFPSSMLRIDAASEEAVKLRSELTDKYYALIAKQETETSKKLGEDLVDREGDFTSAVEDINTLDEVEKKHDGISNPSLNVDAINSDTAFDDLTEEELTKGIYDPLNTTAPFDMLDIEGIEPIEAPMQEKIPIEKKKEKKSKKSKKSKQDQPIPMEQMVDVNNLDDLDAQLDLKVLSDIAPQLAPGETKDDRARYLETAQKEEAERSLLASREIEGIALRDSRLQQVVELEAIQAELERLKSGSPISGKAHIAITLKAKDGRAIPLTAQEMEEGRKNRIRDIEETLDRVNAVDQSGQSEMDRLKSTKPLSNDELEKLKDWHTELDKDNDRFALNRPNEAYVNAVMQLDSWLQPGDAEKLMSPNADARREVIDVLMGQSDKYHFSDKSFTESYFEKNGEKITEIALMIPAVMRLIQQEARRNGGAYNSDLEVMIAQNSLVTSLYQGYSNYTMLKGVKLGDVTKEKASVANAYQSQGLLGAMNENDPVVAEQVKTQAKRIVQDELIVNRLNYAQTIKQRQKYVVAQVAENQGGQQRIGKTSRWDRLQYNREAEMMATKVYARLEEKEKEPKAVEKEPELKVEQVLVVDSQAEIELEQAARKQVGQINLEQDKRRVFDKKATAEPGYKERKEQKKQRARAIAKTGSARGVTHLTGTLMDGIEQAELARAKALENESAHNDPVADAEYRKTVKARQNNDGSKAAQKEDTPEELAFATQLRNETNDLAGWMNEADREMLRSMSATWALRSPVMRQRAAEAVGRAIKKATEFKLTADSFSVTNFAANAQTITELQRCLTPLQRVAVGLKMQESPEMQLLNRYREQFECLHTGFSIFLQNNGISESSGSYSQGETYKNASQQNYQKELGTMLQDNAIKLREAYTAYSKSLNGG